MSLLSVCLHKLSPLDVAVPPLQAVGDTPPLRLLSFHATAAVVAAEAGFRLSGSGSRNVGVFFRKVWSLDTLTVSGAETYAAEKHDGVLPCC
ncbi:hypothetical protein JOB18_020404 [Solea senegalensis]|uniref:Uncharacterized protein n=1 Tax=Solea senegalensis TaxID=28829 RepID=A0AAV6RCM2_SOLSE|nr:hypothetical protein JOB18_020404 [Solea senegalensis]